MNFIDQKILDYAESHSMPEPELIYKLNRYTNINLLKPRMLSGHLQGRLLSMISHLMQPRYVLDIGTYTGYSALCLAEGLSETGILYTIDNNEEVMKVAERFIKESEFHNKIQLVHGEALQEIKKLNDKIPFWDLIWMDANKSDYIDYFELCINKLRPGGLILADNVLWSGKVIHLNELQKDSDTELIDRFNQQILEDTRVENILLPVRDGIMMIRKK